MAPGFNGTKTKRATNDRTQGRGTGPPATPAPSPPRPSAAGGGASERGAGEGGERADDSQRRIAFRFGLSAESRAAALLIAKGYRILARRFRTPLGEIDIVARRRGVLVFVEV